VHNRQVAVQHDHVMAVHRTLVQRVRPS
jgi:hypothetical protein